MNSSWTHNESTMDPWAVTGINGSIVPNVTRSLSLDGVYDLPCPIFKVRYSCLALLCLSLQSWPCFLKQSAWFGGPGTVQILVVTRFLNTLVVDPNYCHCPGVLWPICQTAEIGPPSLQMRVCSPRVSVCNWHLIHASQEKTVAHGHKASQFVVPLKGLYREPLNLHCEYSETRVVGVAIKHVIGRLNRSISRQCCICFSTVTGHWIGDKRWNGAFRLQAIALFTCRQKSAKFAMNGRVQVWGVYRNVVSHRLGGIKLHE